MIALSSTGSRSGSSSFSTFSMRHRPSPMVNSSWSFRFLAASVVMVLFGDRLMRSLSLDLIHRFAWPCGSTINGNRDDRVTMIPFCTERSSEGSPSSDHSPIVPCPHDNHHHHHDDH